MDFSKEVLSTIAPCKVVLSEEIHYQVVVLLSKSFMLANDDSQTIHGLLPNRRGLRVDFLRSENKRF